MAFTTLTIDLGDSAKLPVTLTVGGVLTDPTTLSLELKSPSGTVTTYTYAASQITRNSVGDYQKILDASILNATGKWFYSYVSTGTAAGAEQGVIVVLTRSSQA